MIVKHIKKTAMFIPFHFILKPLIKRNYRLRAEGIACDEWYWADTLALHFGFYVREP